MTARRLLLPSLAIAAALVGACGDDDDEVAEGTDTTTSTAPAPDAVGDTVTIERSRFEPGTLEVAVGAEVTFENRDPYAHTVTSADDSAVEFDSGEVPQGETFSQSFDEPGTYAYVCRIHPSMQASVVVD